VLDGLARTTTGFDFLVGTWDVHNRRLRRPLSGSDEWYETQASASSTTLHNGAISVDEMWYAEEGFAGTSFRTYEPASDVWTISWVNSTTGRVQPPVSGRWDEAGEVFDAQGPDVFDGRPILASYRWHSITAESAVWEQAFSADDGATWETNWVMTWTRVS
jgi:hypothetical protein